MSQNRYYGFIFESMNHRSSVHDALNDLINEARQPRERPPEQINTVMAAKRGLCRAKGLLDKDHAKMRVRDFNRKQNSVHGNVVNVACTIVGTMITEQR